MALCEHCIAAGVVATLVLTAVSCRRNVFDEEKYNELVEVEQPVTGIEKSHPWSLVSTNFITLKPSADTQGLEQLQILSGNPVNGVPVIILGDYTATDDALQYLSFPAPSDMKLFYAAMVYADGTYTLKPFTRQERTVNFADADVQRVAVDRNLLKAQTFTYGFEDEMPEPGDYDYNDVVLRISQQRTAANQVTLNITLAAVGSLNQVAAALRLVNYKYDDIASVTTIGNERFDDGYKKSKLPFIDSNDLLMKGRNGEAVLNLFEDAHWATGAAHYVSEGYIPRYKYNVAKNDDELRQTTRPRTISYVVTFSNPAALNYQNLSTLDPFVIVEYNGVLMENHGAFRNRTDCVLHKYVQPTSARILPWALEIPDGDFRYPLDGVNIGFAQNGALFGAYMTRHFAFGEWAANHFAATNWYHYPTSNMVY